MTLLQRDQLDFWTGFEDYASKHARRITPTAPQPDTWMSLAIGKVGFELGAVASTVGWDGLAWSGPPGIRAEFKIIGDLANARFESLRQGRDGIQTAFPGEHLTWHSVQGVQQRLVLLQKPVDWRDTSKRHECYQWLVWTLDKLHEVFAPLVNSLWWNPGERRGR